MDNDKNNVVILRALLLELLRIKDIRLARTVSDRIYRYTKDRKDLDVFERIKALHELLEKTISSINENNVLMFCLDGLRRCDFSDTNGIKNVYSIIKKKGRIYSNAYSYSTSTYESLLPSLSESTDTGTESEISSEKCRFIKIAHEQKREIFFYCDSYKIIVDDDIKYTKCSQTITQKIWDFVIDADKNTNGLFYIHELYESHFSFVNPYTKDELVAKGTSILFDFLASNGGPLQTDYTEQLKDSLMYIDDTLCTFFDKLKCSIVIFADHGNTILSKGTQISDLNDTVFTASEDSIRVPLAVISPVIKPCIDDTIMSLWDLNDILIALLLKHDYSPPIRDRILIGRNKIYNPDFCAIYKMAGKEDYLRAFRGTISNDGIKRICFEDGTEEVYDVSSNEEKRIQ